MIAIPRLERATHGVGLYLAGRPELGVSQAEAHVLAYLHRRSGTRINDIHEAFGHRRSTLTSVLDRLEKRKLLRRSTDPHDRRAVVVSLTPAGSSLAKKVFDALRSLESAALHGLTQAEIDAFVRVADALARSGAMAAIAR